MYHFQPTHASREISKPDERCCDQIPFFRARLEATAGLHEILANTEVCARHLGDAVQSLTLWAQQTGVQGEVTVLAIGAPEPYTNACGPSELDRKIPSSFAFGVITVAPQAGDSPSGYRQVPAVRPAPPSYGCRPDVGQRSSSLRLPARNSPAWLKPSTWVA
jgi:hypothetical protein